MKPNLLLFGLLFNAGLLAAQSPGDLIISEYMANSSGVPDDQGEYIEFYNTTELPISMFGCQLFDGSALSVTINQDVTVPAKGFAVLGRNATPNASFFFPSSPPPFSLNNLMGDQIMLVCGGGLVAFTFFDNPQGEGQAMELRDLSLHNQGQTMEIDYQPSSFTFSYLGGSGVDYGSPGQLGGAVLPVVLQAFTVTQSGSTAHIKWSTATEVNNDYFEVEYSLDGRQYEAIQRIRGAGTTQEPQAYQIDFTLTQPGTHFFRLAQYDYDGTRAYFGPQRLQGAGLPGQLKAYPTLTTGPLHLEWAQPVSTNAYIDLISSFGQQMASYTLPVGSRSAALDLSGHAKGAYYLCLRDGSRQRQNCKVILK